MDGSWYNNFEMMNYPSIYSGNFFGDNNIYIYIYHYISQYHFFLVSMNHWYMVCHKVVPPNYKLVYNPNNYRYNPLINPSYSTYKPT